MFGNKQRPNLLPPAEALQRTGSVQDGLEDTQLEEIVSAGRMPEADSFAGALLQQHPHTRTEVAQMIEISRLIRDNLTVSAEEEQALMPSPGFYHRVMSRVESQASVWDFFFQPFARRLVYASMALAILIFAIVVADHNPAQDSEAAIHSPLNLNDFNGAVLVSNSDDLPVAESPDVETDRGTVLVHLASFDQ